MRKIVIVFVGLLVFSMLMGSVISARQSGPTSTPGSYQQPMVIRVNFLEFHADAPLIAEGDYVIDGIVKDENGKTLAVGRPPYTRYIPLEWMDLVIRKDIPKRGDRVFITLYPHTHSTDRMIDINPETDWRVRPGDIWGTEGRALTIEYVIGDVTEGWGDGYDDHRRPLHNLIELDGKVHYEVETIGSVVPLPTPIPTPPPTPTVTLMPR